jgi:putative transposase
MGRQKRIWVPHRFYHIVCRGNRRDPLFKETNDFLAFLHILHQLHEKIPFEIAAYCLMTNHFHLQLRSKTGVDFESHGAHEQTVCELL